MKNKLFLPLIIIIVPMITGLLHIIGFYFQGNRYTQLSLNSSFTTYEKVVPYMARTRLILNKGLIPRWDQLYEYQNTPSPYIGEIIPANIMALFSRIFGSVEKGFIAADFILPLLIFLIVYSFMKVLTKSFLVSIVGGLAVVLVRDFFIYFPYPWAVFNLIFGPENRVNDLIITRNYHPEASMIIYLLAIMSIYFAVQCEKFSFRRIFTAGIFFGLTFYNYIFHWTTFCLALFFLFIISIRKKFSKRIIFITIIGLVIAIPFFLAMINFSLSPFAKEFSARSTGIRTNFPYHRALRFMILPFILGLFIKKKGKDFYFFNSLIFAAAILPDLSYLILGKDLEGYHWVYISLMPLASIYYFLLIDRHIMSRIKQGVKNVIYIFTIICFIYYGFKIQFHSGMKYARFARWTDSENGFFKFLGTLPKNSVVAIFPKFELYGEKNQIMLAATDNYAYVPYATTTVASSDEIVERTLTTLSFSESKEEILNNYLYEIFVASKTYLNRAYFELNKLDIKRKIGEKIDKLSEYCRKYKIDYLILNSSEKTRRNCFYVKKVFQNQEFKVYKIN